MQIFKKFKFLKSRNDNPDLSGIISLKDLKNDYIKFFENFIKKKKLNMVINYIQIKENY